MFGQSNTSLSLFTLSLRQCTELLLPKKKRERKSSIYTPHDNFPLSRPVYPHQPPDSHSLYIPSIMPDSSSSSLRGESRSRRSWTVSAESSALESNGRSSHDSTLERPKTQGGEIVDPKAGPSGFSKLLEARRRRKENKKEASETIRRAAGALCGFGKRPT
jgi:hypothetical protein